MSKRKLASLLTAIILVVTTFSSCMTGFSTNGGSTEATVSGENQIKNIIYMIPDGGGPTLMDLADMVKRAGGIDKTKFPNSTVTDTSPLHLLQYLAGFETTRSANSSVTDSAAGGTALSSGYKTNNGYIGITPSKVPKANILEAAMYIGKATGMVTTAEWPHATPASFSAHATDRNDYLNIYQQIENKNIQVVLGAGYGKVTELEGATIDNATNNGYKVIRTREDAATVKPGDRLWGNVGTSNLPTDTSTKDGRPNLHELVSTAITALSADEDGFFLMVEGSWVDSGGHNSNAFTTTGEYLAFDAAWKVAVDFAKGRNDTIVIGAPDHDTGGLDFPAEMTNEIELIQQGTNPSTFTWTGNGNHTGRNCPVWIYVPEGVEIMKGLNPVPGDSEASRNDYLIDNTEIAPYLASLMGVDLDEVTKELFVDVTTIGNYMPTSKRFVFNNGDKYFHINKAEYVKDGETIKTPGLVTMAINGKYYAPAVMIDDEDWNYVNSGNTDTIEGAGTAESPYIIDSKNDFKDFVMGFATSNYSGKYLKQVSDIDISGDKDLIGLSNTYTFAGIYDGNGHTIKVGYETSTASSLFPKVSGTIANLGVIGSIKSTANSALGGIAQSVAGSGKIINCYSNVNFEGTGFYGITPENLGTINNVYYGGSAKVSGASKAISNGGNLFNCYYIKGCGLNQISEGASEISKADSTSVFASFLNGGTAKAQTLTDITLLGWEYVLGLPEHQSTEGIVTRVRLYPETQTIAKGDKFQFTANIDGKYDYSWGINWSLEPQSEFSGTYIDKNGLLHIDANETATAFTVMAKSKANGGVADSAKVTVGASTVYPIGNGTKENPYLITSEKDFYNFTQKLIGGETYVGVYFKQTRDLDMASYSGYSGIGQKGKFYGIYDGNGHSINVNLETHEGCLFPYTWGTIMNLGSTGVINNSYSAGGIARSLRAADTTGGPGRIVNCWTTCEITGGSYRGGMASTSKSGNCIIANCYVAGKVTGTSGKGTFSGDSYTCYNNYYLDTVTSITETASQLTEADMKKDMFKYLNSGRKAAAEKCNLSEDDLCYWINVENSYPAIIELYPYENTAIDEIAILPDALSMGKGSGRQLAVSPAEISNTDVNWTITTSGVNAGTTVDEYGFVTVASEEAVSEIKVRAALKTDSSVFDEITITVTKSLIPDGTKENPYIIATEADFMQFTTNVKNGNTYDGKYILQTANLDMAGYSGYSGMGGDSKFYGTYNGGGHVINVELETSQGCLFPYTWGTIMNLGSTGYLRNEHSAGGIARSLREKDETGGPGKIVNCWSSAEVSGNYAGGMTPTARGETVIANCFFFGTAEWTDAGTGGMISSGAKKKNNYFISDIHSGDSNNVKITEEQMKTELFKLLNDGLAASASFAGIDEADLIPWRSVNNQNPVHVVLGDLDGSCDIEYIDLTAALVLFAKGDDVSGYKALLDIDGNGTVELLDVSFLLQMITSAR